MKGTSADENKIVEGYAQRIHLTLPAAVNSIEFEKQLFATGWIPQLPLKEGSIIDRMVHVQMRIAAKSADEVRKLLEPESLILLSAEETQPGQMLIDAGHADFKGDADDLEGVLAGLLKDRVSNPVIANTTIRGTVAREMSVKALWALFWSLIAIVIYVTFRFEFRFGIASIFALVHDVSISLGVLAALGIEFDLTIVGALLTVVGYSLNDTIVIFDRIRENLRIWAAKPIREVINISINQTLSRTLLTSLTTLIVVIVLAVLGGKDLAPFSTALICGVLVGTYSSIFVASPLLVVFGGSLRTTLKQVDETPKEPVEPAPNPNV